MVISTYPDVDMNVPMFAWTSRYVHMNLEICAHELYQYVHMTFQWIHPDIDLHF